MRITPKTIKNKLVPAALIAALLCSLLTSCGRVSPGVTVINGVSSRNTISKPSSDASLHFASPEEDYAKTGISSGFIDLRLDEKTGSFGIYDSSAGTLSTALPPKPEGNVLPAINSGMVNLKIIAGTDIYLLNSQDNSVAYGKSSIKQENDGCVFTFDIFPSPDTASKKIFNHSDIGFRVEMAVRLKDGSMNVDVRWNNLTGNPDAFIESIEPLNYFGAYNTAEKGNFLFVPDGCGAIISTSVFDESFESLSFAVYGPDPSCPAEFPGTAVLPSFGIKTGSSAFAALIENGDAAAIINAEKATGRTGYNRVYSSFTITPSSYENNTLCISKFQSVDSIDICYRFLSGKNATYSGMASAIREQLIRDGVLSSRSPEAADSLPFFLTLTGEGKKTVGSIEYRSVLTDFEQTQDMLVRMKNKGIDNVSVRYTAAKTGGCDQTDITSSRFSARLGGKRGLASLSEYISNQNMKLFIDIDILSSAKGFKGKNAFGITGEETGYSPANSVVSAMGVSPAVRALRRVSALKKAVAAVLSRSSEGNYTGVCLNDAGTLLYSDFSQGGMLRQQAAETVAGTVSPLSTGNEIMTVGGNFYMLKNIGSIVDLPLSTNVSKSGAYTPVPFLQLILHGLADYSGSAINESSNSDETLLRYIEYGACPHYKWNYKAISGDGGSDIYYYDNTINSAAEFYAEANACLYDLRDARMTDHYKVSDGVFCTEYDNGAMIYVNYTDRDTTVRGVVVEAGRFLRVN